ncbi:MAG: LPS export ABC transporter permease LptG [Candidatus Accumulibacter sp.]|jgi:lipopolysaccharide export system permease protein|uniref:LPS export ABC transporter permease LptG n=1 Tax=Candidatus Accumulibacter affinis TaxID=2954384 RepID=A0A935W8C5_9PROT|nr:LPS export ABC transporter permease LptG [Candidatus Accumulibacter affinis]MBP9803555.1 LPS export ABC transporter permease LptG [Accumulibacter sp.]
MKIYRRYLAREVTAAILLVLLAFLALFAFFDLLGEIKAVGQGGYQLHHAIQFVLLRTPGRAYELMPIAVLIGTLYALSALARHSEITVLRVSGLSTAALLAGLFQVAGLFALATYVIGEFVAPPAERAAYQMRLKEKGRMVGQDLRSGLWVKDEQSFINVRTVLPDARLRGIRIYEFDEKASLRSVTEAAEGRHVLPDSWRLTDVVQTVVHAEGAEVRKMPELLWRSALNPDILAVLMVSPDRMSLRHLSAYTKHLADNRQQTNRYDIAFWKKVIYPLAALVMVALALPFSGVNYRAERASLKIFAGVMTGILFYMLNGLFANLGAINSWSPLLSAITPSVLFMLTAASMIWWVERR